MSAGNKASQDTQQEDVMVLNSAPRKWTIFFRTGQTFSFKAGKARGDRANSGVTFVNDWKTFTHTGTLPSGHPKSYAIPKVNNNRSTAVLLTCDFRDVVSISEEI